MRISLRLLVVVVFLIVTFSMFTAVTAESTPAVTGIKLNRATYANSTGKSIILFASVLPIDVAGTVKVTWTSSDGTIAKVEGIAGYSSHLAKVTLGRAGRATITATVDGYPGIKAATCKIVSRYVSVSAFRLKETTLNLNPGSEYRLTPEFRPLNATDKSVHYKSDNSLIASVDSETGLVTAGPGGDGIQSTYIYAYTYNGKKARCRVNVCTVAVRSVSISRKTATLAFNRPDITLKLTAKVSPSNVSNDEIMWESSNPAIATVDENGLVTLANTATQNSTVTITAKAKGANSIKATCLVKVRYVPVSKITLSQAAAVDKGEDLRITATVSPSNASYPDVTFSASGGLTVTPAEEKNSINVSAEEAGSYTVTASAVDPKKRVSFKVEVRDGEQSVYRALVVAGFSSPKGSGYLPFVTNDAEGMQDALKGSSESVQYQTIRMVSNLKDKVQLRSAIRSAFKDAKNNDISVLYLGTHGYSGGYVRTQHGAVIRFSEILQYLKPINGDVVIFMASCHSGYLRNYARSVLAGSAQLRRTSIFCSTGVATSSPYVGYKAYPKLSYDHFTRALTEALGFDMMTDTAVAMAADKNGDRKVTLSELDVYLRAQVPESVKASQKNHEAGYLKNGNALPPSTWVANPGLVIASRAEEG